MANNDQVLRIGTELQNGRYIIHRVLGIGGFSITYEAEDTSFHLRVAIKEFFPYHLCTRGDDEKSVIVWNSNDDSFERIKSPFKKEAHRFACLHNPHIVRVHDIFEENGTAYYVMDYIEGESLADILRQTGEPLKETQVRDILEQILDALDCIHGQNPPLYHLNIKPAHIMMEREKAILIDFGSMKNIYNAIGVEKCVAFVCFTSYYDSMEQPDKMGPWTDIYALGATLFHLLTGKRPPRATDILHDGFDSTLFPNAVSLQMQQLVKWMMSPNPGKRPQSVEVIRKFLFKGNDHARQSIVAGNTRYSESSTRYDYPQMACAPPQREIFMDKLSFWERIKKLFGSNNKKAKEVCTEVYTYNPKNNGNPKMSFSGSSSTDYSSATKVYSSVFAPAELKKKSHMLTQVYLHLAEETEDVAYLAKESQADAVRREYIPLDCMLKKGDRVDVNINIFGSTLLMTDNKSIKWEGSYNKCSFDFFVPEDIDVDELSCRILLKVNHAMVGEMIFITKIVDSPRNLNPNIITHRFKKVFISYSHKDRDKVQYLANAFRLQQIDYFFDRDYLKGGDVFPLKIKEYIDSADLFVLCWSENAAKSEYVNRERHQALQLAYPQKELSKATLTIYPLSIEPRADLPEDMANIYNFEVI